MTPGEVLKACEALGVAVSLDQGKLKVSDPKGMLSPALKAELAKNKDGVAAVLGRAVSPPRRGLDPKLIAAGVAGVLILAAVAAWLFLSRGTPAPSQTLQAKRPEPTQTPVASTAAAVPQPAASVAMAVPTVSKTREVRPATKPTPTNPARPTVPDRRDIRSKEPLDLTDPEVAKRFRLLDDYTQQALRTYSEHLKDPDNEKHWMNGDAVATARSHLSLFNRAWLVEYTVRSADRSNVAKVIRVIGHTGEDRIHNVKIQFGLLSAEAKLLVLRMIDVIEAKGKEAAIQGFGIEERNFIRQNLLIFGED